MNEELELLKTLARKLESAGIEYMMTGSMAMALYSTPRMTRDIDIIICASLTDVETLINLFSDGFYIDEGGVRQAIQHKGMFNIIHNDSIIKIDFIVRKNEEYRIEEFSRRRRIAIEGVTVSVVAPEDLILSKLVWMKQSQSELQLRDVRQMLTTIQELDLEYLQTWSGRLGVEDLFEMVKKNA
ncbi:MAG: nucleotidyltransferase [Chitinivibrionales bacterium]|nr:nucleotidyltransferase [Chitinivibrionales bacterium]